MTKKSEPRTCGNCKFYYPGSSNKNEGDCRAPIPMWVGSFRGQPDVEKSSTASLCDCFQRAEVKQKKVKKFSVEVRVFDGATRDFEYHDVHGFFGSAAQAKAFVQKNFTDVDSNWEKVIDEERIFWQNWSKNNPDYLYGQDRSTNNPDYMYVIEEVEDG